MFNLKLNNYMPETKEITRLHVVIDTENHYDKIGDIDGGMFDERWLENYIKSHGSEKLLKKLAQMQTQVINTETKINLEIQNNCCGSVGH